MSIKMLLKATNKLNIRLNKHISMFDYSKRGIQKWDLLTAVCIERRPIITPELNKIEEDFQTLLSQVEFENSYKSNHEMRHEDDLRHLAHMKTSKDIDLIAKQTAQDYEDAGTVELSKFKFASRTTKADGNTARNSINRKLDKHLLLLVEQQVGENQYFLPPQGFRENGETLRQTAERTLKQVCGNEIKAQIYGNAPSGFYKYKYPRKLQNKDVLGAKIFIFWAKYLQGDVDERRTKFHWLDKQEIEEFVPSMYCSAIKQFIMDDNH